ncbi:flagellar hook-basal body protein [Granulicella tundricola]|uniref:Flagellar hook-basal body protein n=1 Tax=Granulicella tundricola (strain ATCC BAA-1859 / DSM 23138 / MP5ACTX9) TaxID=1198114 RepID=E8X3V7_GRATM|nr:flagellar hook basal-body protein [Granulicella tundricola]ADW69385.1 flagellar hook-basal body protein [Granulicella tundricola MP5ACTX9]
MDSGLYAAYTGLLARTQALDTAANNLANASTNGFRAQRDSFSGVLASGLAAGQQGSQVGVGINSYGVLGGSSADQSQGPMVTTSNPLDVAINGTGFFAIRTAHGVRYTRDGAFTLSAQGQLQTGAGEPVLNTAMAPITLPSGEVQISGDGTVAVQTAAGSGVVGQLGIFDFASTAGLTQEGANRFKAPDDAVPTASTAMVKQGAVEGANQDSVHGTMQLVLIQRQAEMMQKALSVFNADFDKTATEQIARV